MTASHLWTLRQARAALGRGAIDAVDYLARLTERKTRLAGLCAFVGDAAARPPATPPAAGPLGGMPLAVKDNIDVAGVPTTACTPALRHHTPGRDSVVWERCAEAGAVLMGKTTLHELAYGVTGAHPGELTARNPVAPDRLAGGSSSGTAAAVAAGVVPAGLGTDTGGSIRIPAALCGVVGFRPSTGRYPHQGVVRISPTRDTVGVMARSVEDVQLLDTVLSGAPPLPDPPPSAPPVLALPRAAAWTELDPEVTRVMRAACDSLRDAGWSLRELPEPVYDTGELMEAATAVPLAETPAALTAYLSHHGSPLTGEAVIEEIASPDVRALLAPILTGHVVGPDRYHAARRAARRTAASALRALRLSEASAFMSPTTITPAPPLGTGRWVECGDRRVPTFTTYIRNTAAAAVWGWPSLTLPAGYTSHGLPVGLLLDAPRHHDRQLLALGRRCARHLPPFPRPPEPEIT